MIAYTHSQLLLFSFWYFCRGGGKRGAFIQPFGACMYILGFFIVEMDRFIRCLSLVLTVKRLRCNASA